MKLNLEEAKQEHTEQICNLVNLAYRGEVGWTKETGIVSGDRTNAPEVEELISNPDARLLVSIDHGEVIACICVEREESSAYISLFAVHPRLQGKGVGKAILSQAEKFAIEKWAARKIIMVVVSQRYELISYYERRGYVRTGRIQAYPSHLNVGIPRVTGLTIEYLEKDV